MKYVIFKKNDLLMPIIFNEMINHCDVKVGKGFEPVSAGFCFFDLRRVKIDPDRLYSMSLGIRVWNVQMDTYYLNALINELPTSVFLDFDNNYGNAPRKIEPEEGEKTYCSRCGRTLLLNELLIVYGTPDLICRDCLEKEKKNEGENKDNSPQG